MAISAVIAVLLLAAALFVIHLPFVRARALDFAAAQLASRYNLSLQASRLDYNLLTRRVTLDDVRLAATSHEPQPFFTAGRVEVELPWSVFRGTLAFDHIGVQSGAVSIRRAEDGTSNLPPGGEPNPNRPPFRLNLRGLTIEGLDFAYVDRARDIEILAGDVHLDLDAGRVAGLGGISGPLGIREGVRVAIGERTISAQPIDGSIGFDGSNVGLLDVHLRTVEADLRISGRVDRVFDRPALDLALDGNADVARAAEWGDLPVALGGTTKLSGTISGPVGEPTILLGIDTGALAIGGVSGIAAQAQATITVDDVVVDKALLRHGAGTITGAATIPFREGTRLEASAEWRDLEARTALAMAELDDRPLATMLTGAMRYARTGDGPVTWRLSNRARRSAGDGVAVSGDLELDVADGRWLGRQQHAIPGTLSVAGDLAGLVEGTAFSAATIDGRLDATIDDVSRASLDLERLGLDLPAVAGSITGPVEADVTLAGRIDAIATRSIVESGALKIPGLVPASVYAEVGTDARAVRIDNVNVSAGGATVSGDAALDLTSRLWSGAFEIRAPDAGALLESPPGGIEVRGPFTVQAVLGGTAADPRVTADVDGAGLHVAGQPIDALTAHVGVSGDGLAVESFEARQGDGVLSGSGSYAWDAGAYTADLAGTNLTWRGALAGAESAVRLTMFRYAGAGTIERPGGEASAAFEIVGGVAGTLVGEGRATARFTGESALVTVQVPSLGAFADSRIATSAPYAYDAVAVVNKLDLATLAPLLGAQPGVVAGNVSLSATVNGLASEPANSRAFVNLQEIGATVSGVPVSLAAPAHLEWQPSTLTVDDLNLQVGQGRLRASGALVRSGAGNWDAAYDGELQDLVRMSRAFGAPAELDAGGRVTLRWQSTAGLDASTATLHLAEGRVAWGDVPPVTALDLQASFDGRTIDVPTLTAVWQGGRIEGSGSIPRAILDESAPGGITEPGRVRVRVVELGAAAFAPWVGRGTLDRLQGALSASLDAELFGTTLADVRATLTLDEAAYTAAGVEVVQERPSRVRLADGIVTLEEITWRAGASVLTLTGSAGLDPAAGRTIDVAMAGDVDLRILTAFAPALATDGTAAVDLRASGALDDPRIAGRVQLVDAELSLREPRIVVGQVNGPIVLDGERISFDGIAGTLNGGDLSLHGALTIRGASIAGGQLVAQVQGAALDFPEDLRSEISALVTLAPEDGEWILGGDVRIVRSAYTEPISVAALVAARQVSATAPGPPGRSWQERVRLNLFVVTEESLRIDNNYGRVEADAAVRVVGSLARPGVTGRVTLAEGSQFYLAGNTFYVERGAITFTSPTRIEPELDIRARAVVSGTDLTLTLTGTINNLKTEVQSSDPLVTDREAREALFGGLVGDEQALTLLSGELLGVTGRALGLDALRIERGFDTQEFREDPTLIATETDPSTRLTLSKRLGPQVEVILSQSLSESGALSAIVSYKPVRNIEIRATSRDNIDASMSVRHEITFGGGGGGSGAGGAARPQPRITAVRIVGNPGRPLEDIRRQLDLKEGDRFDFYRWQRDIDAIREWYLENGYYEARVRGTRAESEDQTTVEIEYQIERGPMTRLVLVGHPLDEGLIRELRQVWARALFDQFLLEEIEARIRLHLLGDNWIGSTVEAAVTVSTPDEKEVRVSVDAGVRVARRVIRYTGNAAFEQDRLDAAVAQAGVQMDGWLDPPRLAQAIETFYRMQGYLSVEAIADPPVVEGDTGVLPVRIDEGARYTVGAVNLNGVSDARRSLAEAALQALQVEAPYDPAAVDNVAVDLEQRYARLGYNDVRVEPSVEAHAESSTVTITFQVTEGRQHILREVVIEGGDRTREGVIRRALRLRPGQPVDLDQWSQARKRMYDTNVFRQVDIEPVPMEPTPADIAANIQPVRAVVRVLEYPEWRLRYGGQYRQESFSAELADQTRPRGVGILADLQNQNLFGRALIAGVAVNAQQDRQAASLFTSNASIFGLPVRSNAFFFGVRERRVAGDFFETQSDRYGFSAEQRWRPFRQSELTYGYRYERNHTFDVNPNPFDPLPFDETASTGRLTSAIYVDRRNDPFNATSGWFSSANYEQAASWLGSFAPNSKVLLQQFYYRPVGKIVLASAARIGWAYHVDQIVDVEDRFLAGGSTTIRGYAQDAVGPRDIVGRPRGGGGLLILNQEVRFPIVGRIGGVGFFDAGNVWPERSGISLGDLVYGYGVGLRLNTPFALLRVDYGIPGSVIFGRPANSFTSGRWYFGIGQVF